MGVAERKERDRQEMQEMILDAATKLFVEQGFENVSIRRIAEAIEYSPATIYLYFRDKDEIFGALHNRAFQKFDRALSQAASDTDPIVRLRQTGRAYIQFALDNPEYYDLMFIMNAPVRCLPDDEPWKAGSPSFEMLRATVRDCVVAGHFPSGTDINGAAFGLWALVHGIASLVIRKRTSLIPEEALGGLIEKAFDFLVKE